MSEAEAGLSSQHQEMRMVRNVLQFFPNGATDVLLKKYSMVRIRFSETLITAHLKTQRHKL
jgi:hypothetical protein